MSSAKTPPGPERHERPEDGVLDDAGEELRSARDHRLDDHRRADPPDGVADGRLVSEVERDAARLGLVRPGGRDLDDHRKPDLVRGCDRLVHRVRDPLGDERYPIGEQ